MASDAIMSAIERFDRAAQDWGFESDAGTGGVKSAGAEYTAAKAALLALVTAPEVKDVVLKPCPLDNHPVVMQETLEHYPVEGGRPAGAYTVGYSIFCANCGLHIHDESEEDLLKLWNGRAGVEFVDGMEKPARALEQAHTLLLAIEQTPANVWHVAVDDPEIMCSEVIEAVESAGDDQAGSHEAPGLPVQPQRPAPGRHQHGERAEQLLPLRGAYAATWRQLTFTPRKDGNNGEDW